MDKIATKCEEHFIAAITLVYCNLFQFLRSTFFLNILLGRENHSKTWASSTYVGSSKCLEFLRLGGVDLQGLATSHSRFEGRKSGS